MKNKIQNIFDNYINNPNHDTKNALVLAALPAVEQVVSKFQNGKVIEKNDLFQEGVLGIYSAIEKCTSYDQFEKRLYSIIKSFVLKYSIKQDQLSTNQYCKEKANKINRFIEEFSNTNLREPTNEEISKGVGIKTKNLMQFTNSSCSVYELEDVIPSEVNVVNEIDSNEQMNQLLSAIETKLSPIEQNIIKKKYGIGQPAMTLESIGLSMQPQICKQRVDQIHRKILSKIRKYIK